MSSDKTRHCLAFEHHDHRLCQHELLATARDLCKLRRLKLTPRRQQVLEILLQSHQPMGAYDILAQINKADVNAQIAPPIVYRALDFLLEEGLIHRIECRNAFIGCIDPGHQGAAQFLICKGCEKVAELDKPASTLHSEASRVGFVIDHSVVEVTGFCADCQQK
ncbi:MAG: transcriptional repressor [Gammaproteobacteria bacterium]|nr:transcriptional repressor [Gammaproteobacteria bacterium]